MIEVKNIIKRFGELTALDNISLSIVKGETVGVVGESGSGKSTLARIILKLIEPSSGSIIYDGIENIRRDCQIVFQDPQTSLNPRIKIGEAIHEPLLVHKLNMPGRVKELLELVKLPVSYADRYPHELSGGERQRVGVARALASKPKFIILDEPVSSLDVSIQLDILNLLKELKVQLNLTYLFIAHDLSVIGYLSDRVVVMREGKIVEGGTKDEVLSRPKEPYTRKLIASSLHL
jgi:ABC-type glutathione transport system ATPase component